MPPRRVGFTSPVILEHTFESRRPDQRLQGAGLRNTRMTRPRARKNGDGPGARAEALVYRAELALVLHDPQTAAERPAHADRVVLSPDEARRAAPAFETATDLAAALR